MLFRVTCGIDENGLGPFLGPLVVTAYETEGPEDVLEASRVIKDSKMIFSRRPSDFALIEKLFVTTFGQVEDLHDLFRRSRMAEEIKRICPLSPEKICFPRMKIPQWSDVSAKARDDARESVRFIIACPKLLRAKIEEFGSKFRANAFFMCILALESRSEDIVCGKSGYQKSYVRELKEATRYIGADERIKVLEETSDVSSYELEKTGKRVSFVKDADTRFPHVAKASVIGKYIRELCMLALTRFASAESVFPESGYGKREPMMELVIKMMAKLRALGVTIDEADFVRGCVIRDY